MAFENNYRYFPSTFNFGSIRPPTKWIDMIRPLFSDICNKPAPFSRYAASVGNPVFQISRMMLPIFVTEPDDHRNCDAIRDKDGITHHYSDYPEEAGLVMGYKKCSMSRDIKALRLRDDNPFTYQEVIFNELEILRVGNIDRILPDSLPGTILCILFDNYKHPIVKGTIPSSARIVIFTGKFNSPIEEYGIPFGVEFLIFDDLSEFDQELVPFSIPSTVRVIKFGRNQKYSHPIVPNVLPDNLEHLVFCRGSKYNHPFPSSTSLTNLITLQFRGEFNQDIKKFMCPNLKMFVGEGSFSCSLSPDKLPRTITELYLGARYNHPILYRTIPYSTRRISLNCRNLPPISPNTIPKSVTHLRLIECKYDIATKSLPQSITVIDMLRCSGNIVSHSDFPLVNLDTLRIEIDSPIFDISWIPPTVSSLSMFCDLLDSVNIVGLRSYNPNNMYFACPSRLNSMIVPRSVTRLAIGGCVRDTVNIQTLGNNIERLDIISNNNPLVTNDQGCSVLENINFGESGTLAFFRYLYLTFSTPKCRPFLRKNAKVMIYSGYLRKDHGYTIHNSSGIYMVISDDSLYEEMESQEMRADIFDIMDFADVVDDDIDVSEPCAKRQKIN